ncbi:hypothetical protein [Nonomuraea candida]|nr:hypothetical protein [Nonomuraea candida]
MHEFIEQAAEDAWTAFAELTANGFDDDQAAKLVPTILFTADRRAGK